jgi:hypothetical protein
VTTPDETARHQKSLYWAEHARARAQEIKAQISDERTAAINKEGGEEGGEDPLWRVGHGR